jgi:hypothetical protein
VLLLSDIVASPLSVTMQTEIVTPEGHNVKRYRS